MDTQDADAEAAVPIKVWGVAALAPKQRAAVQAHCLGDCGQISMGGLINDPVTGGLLVCCQSACPYMAEEMEGYGTTLSFGKVHTVTLRLLKPEGEDA